MSEIIKITDEREREKMKRERNKGVVQVHQMWNEILGSQYKGFAIKAQRLNIYLYTTSYKTQIKRMSLITVGPPVIKGVFP